MWYNICKFPICCAQLLKPPWAVSGKISPLTCPFTGYLFLTVLICGLSVTSASSPASSVDVIVVGAGLSGLAAARRLTNYGGFNVTVLEAREDRYGGRVWTDTSLGVPVDLGCTWIHGSGPANPITRLAREAHLGLVTLDAMKALRMGPLQQGEYPPDLYLQRSVDFVQMMLSVTEMAQAWPKDMSLRDAITSTAFSTSLHDPYMLLLTNDIIMARTGADVANISAKLLDSGQSLDGPEQLLVQGFSRIADKLVLGFEGERPLQIVQGQVVESVSVGNRTVEVVTRDGERYHGNAAIITVPLGVLQAEDIQFSPPLPKKKSDAIHAMGFGVQERLVLEFDEFFWDDRNLFFSLAPEVEADMGFLTTWINYHALTERPILLGLLDGGGALVAQNMTDEELKLKSIMILSQIFGGDLVQNRTVTAVRRTRWYNDTFARGTSSYYPVGSHPDVRLALAAPQSPELYWAGEHTSPAYFGTLHGAYFSGIRAAGEFLAGWAPAHHRRPPIHHARPGHQHRHATKHVHSHGHKSIIHIHEESHGAGEQFPASPKVIKTPHQNAVYKEHNVPPDQQNTFTGRFDSAEHEKTPPYFRDIVDKQARHGFGSDLSTQSVPEEKLHQPRRARKHNTNQRDGTPPVLVQTSAAPSEFEPNYPQNAADELIPEHVAPSVGYLPVGSTSGSPDTSVTSEGPMLNNAMKYQSDVEPERTKEQLDSTTHRALQPKEFRYASRGDSNRTPKEKQTRLSESEDDVSGHTPTNGIKYDKIVHGNTTSDMETTTEPASASTSSPHRFTVLLMYSVLCSVFFLTDVG